jgi:hypothetical protein
MKAKPRQPSKLTSGDMPMPVVSKDKAVELLTKEIEQKLPADEVLEVYNELFPKDRRTEAEASKDVTPLVKRLVAYINGGQPIEEIVELWNLIFTTRYRNVGYDEETEGIHYDEAAKVTTE